jgi:hypothetical protein
VLLARQALDHGIIADGGTILVKALAEQPVVVRAPADKKATITQRDDPWVRVEKAILDTDGKGILVEPEQRVEDLPVKACTISAWPIPYANEAAIAQHCGG